MSQSESFIEEVTEEVRRDRLFALMRRYGWIAVAVVMLIVGGAAYNEFSKSRQAAQAEALGDAMLAAVTLNDSAARAGALGRIAAEGGAQAIVGLLQAAELQAAENPAAAAEALEALARNGDFEEIYRDIAAFKALLIRAEMPDADLAALRQGFDALAQPGQPLRGLALEQLAHLDIRDGNRDAAIESLRALMVDADATDALRRRAGEVIVALGAPLVAPEAATE